MVNLSRNVGVMKSVADQHLEFSEAAESLRDALTLGTQIQTMMDDLVFAQESLEKCGYSDQWLQSLNKDGQLLAAVNLDMSKLVGTKDEKTQAALEGFWSTVWDYVKKIWDFIINLVKKVVSFIASMFNIQKMDADNMEKAQALLKVIMGKHSPEVICDRMGEAINEIGGGKAYDLRDLITRMNVLHGFAWELGDTDMIYKLAGTLYPDASGVSFNEEFITFAVGASGHEMKSSNAPRYNYFLKNTLDRIERDPGSLAGGGFISGFQDFKPVRVTNLRDAMTKSGISMAMQDGQVIFKVDQVQGKVLEINYMAPYRKLEDYFSVMNEYIKILKLMYRPIGGRPSSSDKSLHNNVKRFEDIARKCRTYADQQKASLFGAGAADAQRARDAFICYSRWMLEVAGAMTTCINAFNATNTEARKIYRVMNRVAHDLASEAKK